MLNILINSDMGDDVLNSLLVLCISCYCLHWANSHFLRFLPFLNQTAFFCSGISDNYHQFLIYSLKWNPVSNNICASHLLLEILKIEHQNKVNFIVDTTDSTHQSSKYKNRLSVSNWFTAVRNTISYLFTAKRKQKIYLKIARSLLSMSVFFLVLSKNESRTNLSFASRDKTVNKKTSTSGSIAGLAISTTHWLRIFEFGSKFFRRLEDAGSNALSAYRKNHFKAFNTSGSPPPPPLLHPGLVHAPYISAFNIPVTLNTIALNDNLCPPSGRLQAVNGTEACLGKWGSPYCKLPTAHVLNIRPPRDNFHTGVYKGKTPAFTYVLSASWSDHYKQVLIICTSRNILSSDLLLMKVFTRCHRH